MTTQPDWTTRLLTGCAEHLASHGVGVWRPTGVYTAGETGITILVTPASPDRIITLSPYDVTTNPGGSDVIQGLQVRVRAGRDPREALDLADHVRRVWHGQGGLDWSGIHVAYLWRVSQLPLGPDANGRHEISGNYYLRAAHPSLAVTD